MEHRRYNVSVTYHPPPEHRLQGGLYSELRFSLCLCHKEHAMWLDEDAGKFPVEQKHLDCDSFTDKTNHLICMQLHNLETKNNEMKISSPFQTEHLVQLYIGKTKCLLSKWTCDPVEEVTKH